MRKTLFLFLLSLFLSPCMGGNPSSVKWDHISLIVDGKRTVPVMGEIHYSRIPADEWNKSIKEMKKGGVTIIATYVFWSEVFASFPERMQKGRHACHSSNRSLLPW